MSKIIISTGALYHWFGDYEAHLDDRIHTCLDAGYDGVELLNGPSILDWNPPSETIERLKKATVTIHAELYPKLGVTIQELTRLILSLPFRIENVVFHPDELDMAQFPRLGGLPFPVSLENMDKTRFDWRTPHEIKRFMHDGVGLTYDTAHAEEQGMGWNYFYPIHSIPVETHLSIPDDGYYQKWGWTTRHALTQFRPDRFPVVPKGCPILTVEGVVPVDVAILRNELEFIKRQLN